MPNCLPYLLPWPEIPHRTRRQCNRVWRRLFKREVFSNQEPALPLHGVFPALALGPRERPGVLHVGGPEVAVQVRTPLHLPRRGGVELGFKSDLEDPEGRGLLEEEASRRRDLGECR